MPDPEQDIDLNGNKSNSYTRKLAEEQLASSKTLTPDQQNYLTNQTKCARGDELRKRPQEQIPVQEFKSISPNLDSIRQAALREKVARQQAMEVQNADNQQKPAR